MIWGYLHFRTPPYCLKCFRGVDLYRCLVQICPMSHTMIYHDWSPISPRVVFDLWLKSAPRCWSSLWQRSPTLPLFAESLAPHTDWLRRDAASPVSWCVCAPRHAPSSPRGRAPDPHGWSERICSAARWHIRRGRNGRGKATLCDLEHLDDENLDDANLDEHLDEHLDKHPSQGLNLNPHLIQNFQTPPTTSWLLCWLSDPEDSCSHVEPILQDWQRATSNLAELWCFINLNLRPVYCGLSATCSTFWLGRNFLHLGPLTFMSS